jgi:hypothetical protein
MEGRGMRVEERGRQGNGWQGNAGGGEGEAGECGWRRGRGRGMEGRGMRVEERGRQGNGGQGNAGGGEGEAGEWVAGECGWGDDVVNRVDVRGFCGYGGLRVSLNSGGDECRTHT